MAKQHMLENLKVIYIRTDECLSKQTGDSGKYMNNRT